MEMRKVISDIFHGQSFLKNKKSEFRGILAADESTPTIKKRFDSIDVESTPENREAYRKMLFSTPDLEKYVGGVILFDETIRTDGVVKMLEDKGIIPGIKVDKGAKQLPFSPGETVTEGLDGLRDRLKEYKDLGAKFAKWRAVLTTMPSEACIHANAHALARYAALCQEQGIVPIVEPEMLMDGVHSISTAYIESRNVLRCVFNELDNQGVKLNSIILKPNMILTGYKSEQKTSVVEIANLTVGCFLDSVPASVPAIAFLSGGQPDDEAIANLRMINHNSKGVAPWALSFSFGRALQGDVLKTWLGKEENVEAAQQALLRRAKECSFANQGLEVE
jgi:fructose-bisphosphate aldolase class I